MHCCLITAPTITEFRSRAELTSQAVRLAASEPQLGILSVASTLERCGDTPHILDANSAYIQYAQTPDGLQLGAFAEHLAELAARSNADLYGFSSICSTYPLSIRVARELKRIRPYATVLFGGPQASVVDVDTLTAFPFVDYILRGEVEQTLPQLFHLLWGEGQPSEIGGLTWRDGNTVRRNPNAPVIEDLDDLPPPAYHLSNYLQHATSASIELGRGCPFSCTFCSTNDFFRRRFRLRSPAKVLADMRGIAATYGIRHFDLVHDMFTVDPKRVAAFCHEMQASGEDFTWYCSARTDCVDEPLLELMAASGCRGVFFGIETGSTRMQRIIDKDLDPARAHQILDIAQRLGMKTTASLITGFPEEHWDDLRDTLRVFTHAARCSLSHPQLNLLAPLANTPIHTNHKHEMVLDELCSDMSHQGLSQHRDDLHLIRQYPDIFPNFYLIPVKDLDRDILFDLREFLGMTVECFRWILGAIDQATDLLDFHREWRLWRIRETGTLSAPEQRRYYATARFRQDFLRFLGAHPLGRQTSIAALIAAEQLLNGASSQSLNPPNNAGNAIPPGTPPSLDLIPIAGEVLQLEYRLEEIVHSIASKSEAIGRGVYFYTVRTAPDGPRNLVEISSWLAAIITACDGASTVEAILTQLANGFDEIPPEARREVASQLLLGASEAGYIRMHRPTQLAKHPYALAFSVPSEAVLR